MTGHSARADSAIPPNLLQILQSCRTLPSIPGVVLEVLDLSQDPDVGTAEIAKVVSRDPATVAKILKVANSPWCGVRREVRTLAQAVNLLGTNATMSLALSFSLVRALRKATGAIFDHQAYWRRSVISATATLSVGTGIKAANQDELFLSGLLQDIGILALNEAMPTYGRLFASSWSDHSLLAENERHELGTDHAQVGSWLLENWGLPRRLVSAVGTSHQSGNVREPLAKSVAVGGRIAEIWISPNTAAASASSAEIARALLGISDAQFEHILSTTAAQLPEITRNLDIPVGDEQFIHGLLDQAREAVAELNIRALQEARQFAVQAQRDTLTSLYNRTYLDQILNVHSGVSRKVTKSLTVIFIDIDNFKKINDAYGHYTGDSVLVSVARVIQAATRDDDIIVRYGGDEFIVLLNDTEESVGAQIAERIRSMVQEQRHRIREGYWIPVTVSVGCATMSSKSAVRSAAELLEAADRSLYRAKRCGRNRVEQAV